MSAPAISAWMKETFEQGLVSVIVPTYNRAAILRDTLDSVAAQAYRPIELLIIDDGSTDDTQASVEAWTKRHDADHRLTVRYLSQPNRGACAARNNGLSESRGEFIQFLDSDDRLRPDKLKRQIDALHADGARDYVYAQTAQIGSDGATRSIAGRPMDESVPSRNIPLHLWHTSSPLYRRRVCVQAGPWDQELRMSQDWDYAARIKAVSLQGLYLPDVLSEYIMHGSGQIVKRGTLLEVTSRNRAVHNVMDLLNNIHAHEDGAWEVCSRALIAAAIHAGELGDRALMRKNFTEARRLGYTRTRCTACVLLMMSFIVSPKVFKWLLIRVR